MKLIKGFFCISYKNTKFTANFLQKAHKFIDSFYSQIAVTA